MAVGNKLPCTKKKKKGISNDFPADENKIRKGNLLLIHCKEPQIAGAKGTKKEEVAKMWLRGK